MRIAHVNQLEVFDLQHIHYKSPYTVLSLRVDGVAYYSLKLDGIICASSGANTVITFDERRGDAVVAWLDPASDEYIRVDSYGILSMALPAMVLMVTALAIARSIGLPGEQILLIGIGMATIFLALAVKTGLRRRSLEKEMRYFLRHNL
jgi:hypothetical protein